MLPRRVPGALLFPGNMRPTEPQMPPPPIGPDRPREVRRSLSSLRRGVEQGRRVEPAGAADRGTVRRSDSVPPEGEVYQ